MCILSIFQLGVALGFFLPPIIVPDSEDLDEIAMGLRILFISSGVICSIVAVLIFIGELPTIECTATVVLQFVHSLYISSAKGSVSGFEIAPPSKGGVCDKHFTVD